MHDSEKGRWPFFVTIYFVCLQGVSPILDKLRAAGKKVFFVTNNSTKSRKVCCAVDYCENIRARNTECV